MSLEAIYLHYPLNWVASLWQIITIFIPWLEAQKHESHAMQTSSIFILQPITVSNTQSLSTPACTVICTLYPSLLPLVQLPAQSM